MKRQIVKRLYLIALSLVISMSTLIQAAVVANLYEVTLPCESQTENERQLLFKQGLQQVLDRISTEPEMHRYPAVAKALEHAADYVDLYGYDGNEIRIRFSAEAVQPLVQQTGQTTWGQNRPNVMVWLAVEEQDKRRLIGQETDPALYTKLQQMAQQRGVPVVLPLMDIEDINAVSVGDIWGQFPSVLQQASQRYGAKATLVGRLQHLPSGQWQASWQWLTDKQSLNWEQKAESLENALAQGFDRMTTQLKDSYTVKNTRVLSGDPSMQKPILIGIANVNSAEDFVRVENYLEGLDPITRVSLLQVLGDKAIFEVIPQQNQSSETLAQAIGLDHQLMSLGQQDAQFQEVDLAYRWVALGVGDWRGQ